jgi:hypothetical protein
MEIFKKVGEGAKTISESARSFGKKSSDLVGVAKLKYEVAKLEKEVDNNIAALGKLVFLQYKGEKGLEEEIGRLVKVTMELEAEVGGINEQIGKFYPGPTVCPQCQTELPDDANFCYNCGNKLSRDDETQERDNDQG